MTPSPNITLQVTKIAMKIGITLKIYFDWKQLCYSRDNKQTKKLQRKKYFFSDYEIKHQFHTQVNCNLYQKLPQLTKVYIPEVMYITTSKGFI